MRLDLTEEQKLVEETVRVFADSEVKPLAKELDETGQFPRETFRKAAELGLTGIVLPEQYGGAGFDHVSYTIVSEEIPRVCASTGAILAGQNSLYCGPIHRYGTEEQKQRFLSPFARGEKIGCFALTEPQSGSDATALKSSAVRRGDRYVDPWLNRSGMMPRAPSVRTPSKNKDRFTAPPDHAR